jgi:hypothetical protein
MTDFSQQIADFNQYGIYNYMFDSEGNEVLNPSSSVFQQVYFELPLKIYTYNDSKILSFYNPIFTEFVPVPITSSTTSSLDLMTQLNAITYQNTQLQSQLNILVANNQIDTGSADVQSVMNTIINLRISLGQGNTPDDFQDVYPYLPISAEQKQIPLTTSQ